MTSNSSKTLAQIELAIERQDREWNETKQQLRASGDTPIEVPVEALDRVEDAAISHAIRPAHGSALRG